jgi:hypothetical protein
MTRKSKREIESAIENLDTGSSVPDDVGPVEQYFSDEYPDPPQSELGTAWANQLKPDNDTEE